MGDDATCADEESTRSRLVTYRTPTALYEWLRTTGFLTRRSIASIVLEAVAAYRAEVDASRIVPTHGKVTLGRTTTISIHLDNELYEWLRVTAFHARTSVNALVVAALTRAHADYADVAGEGGDA